MLRPFLFRAVTLTPKKRARERIVFTDSRCHQSCSSPLSATVILPQPTFLLLYRRIGSGRRLLVEDPNWSWCFSILSQVDGVWSANSSSNLGHGLIHPIGKERWSANSSSNLGHGLIHPIGKERWLCLNILWLQYVMVNNIDLILSRV